MSRRPPLSTLALLALWPLVAPLTAAAQAAELADRIVAVVDGDPIFQTDIDRALALGLAQPQEGETPAQLRRRTLDGLIAQRLRVHEVERYGFEQVPVELIQAQVAAIRARFPSEVELRRRLRELGMEPEALQQLVAQQLQVMVYVDELLGARVFIGLDEIDAHYQRELVPELRRLGQPVPPLEEVREEIRALLREQRLNDELERWTTELRRQADVEDFLDTPQRPLPPKVGERH